MYLTLPIHPYASSRTALYGLILALLSAPSTAAVHTVCASGCDETTVQAAVDAATAGDTIQLLDIQHIEAGIVVPIDLVIVGAPEKDTRMVAQPGTPYETGATPGRVLTVNAGATVVMRDVRISYGRVNDNGGGLYNLGHLTLERVSVHFNHSKKSGGGIYNVGTLVLRDTAVRTNLADSHGGGIVSTTGSTLAAIDAVLDANEATSIGGNLYTSGDAALVGSIVSLGDAFHGGGVYNAGTLRFSGLVFENRAASGGGIYQGGSGSLDLEGTAIYSNEASSGGGGVYVAGGATRVTDSTLYDNEARNGGGILHDGSISLRLRNTTLSHNRALDDGGGVYVDGGRGVDISSSTFADNSADFDEDDDGNGGGLYLAPCTGLCALTRVDLRNSIVAGNADRSPPAGGHAHECSGELTSDGYNLFDDAGSTVLHACRVEGDLTGVLFATDPLLGVLSDNGGTSTYPGGDPPLTRFLLGTSPAIDGGDPAGCVDGQGVVLGEDQRGARRVGPCDIGAYEQAGLPAEGIFADGFEIGGAYLWSVVQ